MEAGVFLWAGGMGANATLSVRPKDLPSRARLIILYPSYHEVTSYALTARRQLRSFARW